MFSLEKLQTALQIFRSLYPDISADTFQVTDNTITMMVNDFDQIAFDFDDFAQRNVFDMSADSGWISESRSYVIRDCDLTLLKKLKANWNRRSQFLDEEGFKGPSQQTIELEGKAIPKSDWDEYWQGQGCEPQAWAIPTFKEFYATLRQQRSSVAVQAASLSAAVALPDEVIMEDIPRATNANEAIANQPVLSNKQRLGNHKPEDARLVCPLTKEIMDCPVRASDGRVYEAAALIDYLRHVKPISPVTGAPFQTLKNGQWFSPANDIKQLIERLLAIREQHSHNSRFYSPRSKGNLPAPAPAAHSGIHTLRGLGK